MAGSAGVLAGAGAVGLAGCSRGTPEPDGVGASAAPATGSATPSPEGPVELSSWDAVRASFALDPDLAHFSAFTLAAHPEPVRTAIARWREALDTDPAAVLQGDQAREEAVRNVAAFHLGVTPDELALTDSTTMGLGLTYSSVPLHAGDHVLTTTHDFYSTHEALRLAAERAGASVEHVALYDDPASADAQEIVDRLSAAIRPATRLVALTWVHSSTGVKLPVRAIADTLAAVNADRPRARRALLSLDAVHGFGAEDVTAPDLGVDIFISGAHKWLFGPRGTGLVWARRAVGERLPPIIPPFNAPNIGNWLTGDFFPSPFGLGASPGGYKAFEHRWALSSAFEFQLGIGKTQVAARTRELATRLKDGLVELPNVRVITPLDPALSAGLVCCDVEGHSPSTVVERLRQEHSISATVTPYREPYLRFGTSIVTTPDQVDDAVRALAALK